MFGERGLIARAPRSATVTAETDGRLFSMAGEDFLELIGGQAGVRDRLLALYDTPAETFSPRNDQSSRDRTTTLYGPDRDEAALARSRPSSAPSASRSNASWAPNSGA